MNGATITLVVALAGLLGYGIGVGKWQGRMEQMLVDHERRLNAQDVHMEAIDDVASETKATLATIQAQISYLVRQANAAERYP